MSAFPNKTKTNTKIPAGHQPKTRKGTRAKIKLAVDIKNS
jgi:hypothetical protein